MIVRASPAVNAFSAACEARRRERSPAREDAWQDGAATALLVPAAGQAPTWMGPMVPPALVRGSRTELPAPVRPEQPMWPYADYKVQLEEVSLFYPGAPKPNPATAINSPTAVDNLIRDDSSLIGKSPTGGSSFRIRPASQGGQRRRVPNAADAGSENCCIQTNISTDTDGAKESSHQDIVFSPSDNQMESSSQIWRRTAAAVQAGRPASRGGPLGSADWMHEYSKLSASAKLLDRSASAATLAPSPSKDSFFGCELETQICESLRPRTDKLHWEKNLVSKPPVDQRRPEKPVIERPAHTPAFLRAMEKAMTPKHSPPQGRLKSSKLIGAHKRIRRAGQVPEQTFEDNDDKLHSGCTACVTGIALRPALQKDWFKKVRPEDMAEDGSMIVRVLGTIDDTPSSLKEGMELIRNSSEMVEALGGLRHPTTLISGRNLGVLNRKLDVLSPLVEAVEALQKLCDNKKSSLTAVRNGASTKEVAGMAFGIVKKLKDATHPGGRPDRDDRSNFTRFIATFKLPSNHMTLKRGWELVRDEAYDWADVLYDVSQSAVDAERQEEEQATLKSHQSKASVMVTWLIDFVACLGVDIYRPQIEKAYILAQDHQAASVLRYAEASVIDIVTSKTEETADAQAKKAELIEYAIKVTLDSALQISPKHPSIVKAQGIAFHLRSTHLRVFAAELMRGIEHGKPGSAGRVADLIDEAVKEAVQVFGLPVENKNVEAARTMSLQARSEETRLQKTLGRQKNKSG
eukprot:TRINITY_DN15953_c0_g1_i1.p1 TRINITY_DN15953_c0_g1~~TRINITY_DN15953_c0_g1_i1.p1  ORF type:complete len:747 (+),score=120.23 TRINITY_DN15953_c0_g1_i1:168-2408(+)